MSFRFLLSRLFLAVLSLWGVSVLVFAILRILPGDPALLMAPVGSTAEDIERVRREFGLTGSWWAQYGAFFLSLCRGNFGRSLWLQQDALRVIVERLPATLELAITALVLATGGGILLGACSVWRRRSWLESGAVSLGTLGIAVPNFVWGLLLIVVFGAILQVLPDLGSHRPGTRGGRRDGLGRRRRPAAAAIPPRSAPSSCTCSCRRARWPFRSWPPCFARCARTCSARSRRSTSSPSG